MLHGEKTKPNHDHQKNEKKLRSRQQTGDDHRCCASQVYVETVQEAQQKEEAACLKMEDHLPLAKPPPQHPQECGEGEREKSGNPIPEILQRGERPVERRTCQIS
ncbi:hypothetical protein Emed_000012 [Eimeria media]